MHKSVFCRTRFAALHSWPTAPANEEFYLALSHRHEFHVLLEIEVSHEDRQIEFIRLKENLNKFLLVYQPDAGERSCEKIAREIVEWAIGTYNITPDLFLQCEVSEDGENGATVYI